MSPLLSGITGTVRATVWVLFAAVGTSGQRCTTTRRLFLQRGIAGEMRERLIKAYGSITIGDPMDPSVLMGPVVNEKAIDDMMAALEAVKQQGGEVIYGGNRIDRPGYFVEPTLVNAKAHMPITCEETFAPILYLTEFDTLDEAIELHNSVPQGLSSAIFTLSARSAERSSGPSMRSIVRASTRRRSPGRSRSTPSTR